VAFNLDINVPIVKEGNKDSYFGFSVAQHIIKEERYSRDGRELEPILRYVWVDLELKFLSLEIAVVDQFILFV